MEAAVYFCCLEALQNVSKYARAARVEVRLRSEPSAVVFEVEDRLSALGGSLRVRSAPGSGTTLVGRVPLEG